MRYLLLAFCFFIFLDFYLVAQEISIYRVRRSTLKYEKFDWGNELYFEVSGKAHPVLNNATIIVSIWYYKERVRWQKFTLKGQKKYREFPFSIRWGPLNNAYEKVLGGNYKVKIELSHLYQVGNLRKGLEKISKKKSIKNYSRTFFIGTRRSFSQEDKEIKSFYLHAWRRLYQLRTQLSQKGNLALANALKKKEGFDLAQWRAWLDEYLQKVEKEKKNTEKFHKKQFSRRYPVTKECTIEYYVLLRRFAKLVSLRVYGLYKVAPTQEDINIDTFGLTRMDIINRNLKRLLQSSVDELKIKMASIKKP